MMNGGFDFAALRMKFKMKLRFHEPLNSLVHQPTTLQESDSTINALDKLIATQGELLELGGWQR